MKDNQLWYELDIELFASHVGTQAIARGISISTIKNVNGSSFILRNGSLASVWQYLIDANIIGDSTIEE